MKVIEGNLRLKGNEKVAIINGRFNHIITDRLVEGARDAFKRHGGNEENLELILVPGAFEIPFACRQIAESSEKPDAIITFGAVIRGGTPHFEYVCQALVSGIADLNIQLDIPIIFGVLTLENEQQAWERLGGVHGHKGEEAAIAALKMIQFSRSL